MTTYIYRSPHVGIKDMLVSDKTSMQEIAEDLQAVIIEHLGGQKPFVIMPSNKFPMQLITHAEFLHLRSVGIEQATHEQMVGFSDAYQAAN